jgi:hypothetical protein
VSASYRSHGSGLAFRSAISFLVRLLSAPWTGDGKINFKASNPNASTPARRQNLRVKTCEQVHRPVHNDHSRETARPQIDELQDNDQSTSGRNAETRNCRKQRPLDANQTEVPPNRCGPRLLAKILFGVKPTTRGRFQSSQPLLLLLLY